MELVPDNGTAVNLEANLIDYKAVSAAPASSLQSIAKTTDTAMVETAGGLKWVSEYLELTGPIMRLIANEPDQPG